MYVNYANCRGGGRGEGRENYSLIVEYSSSSRNSNTCIVVVKKSRVVYVHSITLTGGEKVESHVLLTSTLDGYEWSASGPCRFNPKKNPRYPLNIGLSGTHATSSKMTRQM